MKQKQNISKKKLKNLKGQKLVEDNDSDNIENEQSMDEDLQNNDQSINSSEDEIQESEEDEEIQESQDEEHEESQEDEQIQESEDEEIEPSTKVKKKRKKGIIYVSNIPKHMNVTRIREILGSYGEIGRVYLQPEKAPVSKKKNKRKRLSRHFTEGWVEFKSKRIAKQIVEFLNNKQISTRKKSQFYDSLWSMKYLPRFKWVHLTERMNYEQAVHKQRLMNEVSQARKETSFFQNNLDKSEFIKKKNKMSNKET